MQDFLAGEDIQLSFVFGTGAEPVIPDVGSVTYTLLGPAGNPIDGMQNVPITTDAATFSTRVSVPASYNEIGVNKAFDRRSLLVRWTKGGVSDWMRLNYRIIPNFPFTVTPAAVRAFLGVNKGELPDEEIDLFSAYIYVQEAVSDPIILSNALSSGDRVELLANDIIAMRAAIDLIPSLQNRVAQSEKNGVMGFDRIKIKDYSGLLADAYARYYAGLGLIDTGVSSPANYILLVTTTDTDPITAGT